MMGVVEDGVRRLLDLNDPRPAAEHQREIHWWLNPSPVLFDDIEGILTPVMHR
jgi:hypothetical protein